MPKSSIRAIRVHHYGGTEELQLEQIPCPEPQAGEVLVRVHAAGVQPVDWKIRSGYLKNYRPVAFPYIPGTPLAGIVEQVGPEVTGFQKGQAVFGRTDKGSYAEYALAPAGALALKPEAISFDEAATIPAGATTAWWALFENGDLQAGQRVLIHGAAGGVGLYAVQFARWKGAQVLATTSTANLEFVRSLGADTVIDYTTTHFEEVAQAVDMVLDTVGGETLTRSFEVVKPGGSLLSIVGQPYQDKAQERGIRPIDNSRPLTVTRPMLETIVHLIEQGEIKAFVGKILPLEEVRQAHELSQSGHGRGRIVLHPAD